MRDARRTRFVRRSVAPNLRLGTRRAGYPSQGDGCRRWTFFSGLLRGWGVTETDGAWPIGTSRTIGDRATESPIEGKPFFPHHFMDRIIIVLLVVAIMISLATFYPAAVEQQADPFLVPESLRPAWYFLPIFQVLRLADRLGWAPGLLGVYGIATSFLVILTWPWLARARRGPAAALLRLVEGAGVVLLVGLTVWGWLA